MLSTFLTASCDSSRISFDSKISLSSERAYSICRFFTSSSDRSSSMSSSSSSYPTIFTVLMPCDFSRLMDSPLRIVPFLSSVRYSLAEVVLTSLASIIPTLRLSIGTIIITILLICGQFYFFVNFSSESFHIGEGYRPCLVYFSRSPRASRTSLS